VEKAMTREPRRAFTLSEILISIAVLSIGMLGLMAAMLYGSRGAEHARRVTEANNYARQILEIIRIRNVASEAGATDSGQVALNAGNYSGTWGVMPANTDYRRQVTCTLLSSAAGVSLYNIKVRVFWNSSGQGAERSVDLVAVHKT